MSAPQTLHIFWHLSYTRTMEKVVRSHGTRTSICGLGQPEIRTLRLPRGRMKSCSSSSTNRKMRVQARSAVAPSGEREYQASYGRPLRTTVEGAVGPVLYIRFKHSISEQSALGGYASVCNVNAKSWITYVILGVRRYSVHE